MIQCSHVNLIYDLQKESQTYALKQINLALEPNRFYGILVPSGSGKSSLLYVLSGLKKPTSGEVLYENKPLSSYNEDELSAIRKKEFGFVFQKHFLIDYLSVLQNVLVPVNTKDALIKAKAIELLNALGLSKHIHKKPYQLSGGQCQRVAIARALIHNPSVIFADEITASLDFKSALVVMDVLKTFRNNATLIVVTHDPSILAGADEILTIRDGALQERSEPHATT